MDNPAGGGRFLLVGRPRVNGVELSPGLALSGGGSPLADLRSLDSIIDRCWSRTDMLR